MTVIDRLRRPPPLDLMASAYKDWLHVNIFDHSTGLVGLCNVSLHGNPDDPRSLAVGAVVLAEMDGVSRARVGVVEMAAAHRSMTSIGIGDLVAISLAQGTIDVAAHLPDGTVVDLSCIATAPSIAAERPEPFGSGWIAWRALPRLAVAGSIDLDGRRISPARAMAYHDHNWGRWHWGDDTGWAWAVLAAEDGTVIVLSQTTDRSHRTGSPNVHVVWGSAIRHFSGHSVRIARIGRFKGRLGRHPGAMAALHGGRTTPLLPEVVRVEADDGFDRVVAELRPIHGIQLITADPAAPGYGFIHEMAGPFEFETAIDGSTTVGSGLGIFEHVD